VADEIQTGMGRTGRMFALEHWGVEPDILCLAKGLASGMPLGAIVARQDIMDWEQGSHASTFGGNPVSCAASLETIALLEEGLIANAAEQGKFLIEALRGVQSRHPRIGDVRGLGLMIGIDLVVDRETKQPAVARRDAVVQACFRRGLLVLGCGESAIRLCPPLVVTHEECQRALGILEEALVEVTTPAAAHGG
jgi:4-aminobutyrate aminotransferase